MNPLLRYWRLAVYALLFGCLAHYQQALGSPDIAAIERAVAEAYENFADDKSGETARYIPALSEADPEQFGIVAVTIAGDIIERGDTEARFAIMSAAKPFTLALLLQQRGPHVVVEKIGVEPTGLPFNSLAGIDKSARQPLNPMVNAGAITAVSLLQPEKPEQRWASILSFFSELAGEPLTLMGDVYESVSRSNYNNRAIVNLLELNGWLEADPATTLDVYNKQSSVGITAKQLAIMGGTLANSGINPITGARMVDAEYIDEVLSVMLLSGFYDESGLWAYMAGLPAKSGVGGGIVAVVPGEFAVVGYSPRLNESGNSVRAMHALSHIANELNLSLFRPHTDE